MSMLDEQRRLKDSPARVDVTAGRRQRRQMAVALGILLLALILVFVKDRQFWFPSPTTSVDTVEPASPANPTAENVTKSPQHTAPAQATPKPKQHTPPAAIPSSQEPAATAGPTVTATQRTVLPPLEVEVVAGGKHRPVQSHNNAVKVDMRSETAPPVAEASAAALTTTEEPGKVSEAAATVHMSAETTQAVSRPVEPSYPLLAKQMKVQGAVVLEALIARSGNIDELRVLSGPAILSSAAMEAVRQWRFKPYYQEGRAVETEARITVNFTISTY